MMSQTFNPRSAADETLSGAVKPETVSPGRRHPMVVNVREGRVRLLAKVGRSGASLRNLATAAEAIGFQASPVRASLDRLATLSSPWIAHWQGEHYVVVYQIRGNQVLMADPAAGKRQMSRAAIDVTI
jgi:ABC-type bacteriocin/lantibiotic exporter with double-glycine peptidase domain